MAAIMRPGKPGRRGHAGFTYIAMLLALAIFGIGLAAVGESWSAASQRGKEEELIQIGAAYVRAIGAYYRNSPGASKSYPVRLEDLVEDKRFVGTVRHLRRVYRDPISNQSEWGLVHGSDGHIRGVYSLSDRATLRRQALSLPDAQIIVGQKYSEWKFVYEEKQ